MYLALIETSGNQNYIFSTNKLKENIGASELTYRAGTSWVLEAVEIVSSSQKLLSLFKNGNQLRDNLLNEKLNPPIEVNNHVEVIVATSGKALLITKEKEAAQKIIQYVTHKALIEAPGLDICGVISDKFDWHKDTLGEINRKLHQKFAKVHSQRPSPDLRFLRLPVIDECSTSGLPASEIDNSEGKPVAVVSSSKRNNSEQGLERIRDLLKKEKPEINFPSSIGQLIEYLDQEENWLSVIHADGNGLGEIFLKFENHIDISNQNISQANRTYVDKLRKFSIALDICTEKAFISALDAFASRDNKKLATVIPLVLGGDDLTVVCDGKNAIRFTQKFLLNFEAETKSLNHLDGIIPEVAGRALGVKRLSACAGIAIIKPKFPFSVAYELSEALMQSAKDVKKKITHPQTHKPLPCSTFDFHILYDSSSVNFKSIRQKLENKQENTKLHNRPYVVTPEIDIQQAQNIDWARFHHFSKLAEKVKVLIAKDDEDASKRKLPNSQIHDLKTGLFFRKCIADARYQLIKDRYRDKDITALAGSEESLFQQEINSGTYITSLLDAIEVAEFLNINEGNDEQE